VQHVSKLVCLFRGNCVSLLDIANIQPMIFWACYLLGLVFVQTVNFCLEMSLGAIHLRRPHGRGRGVRLRWTHVDGV